MRLLVLLPLALSAKEAKEKAPAGYYTFDEIAKRAIEFGTSRLGFDRLGLMLYETQTELIRGSFGTDQHGKLRDERSFAEPMSKFSSWLSDSVLGKKRVRVRKNTPLYDDGEIIGQLERAG